MRDIISEVGVAHGLFYYYFGSKEDVLNAIIDRYYEQYLKKVMPLLENKELRGIDMYLKMSAASFALKKDKESFFGYIGTRTDPKIRDRLYTQYAKVVAPVITAIVARGVEDGSFDTEYPAEAVEAIHAFGTALFSPDRFSEHSGFEQRMGAYVSFTERILGIKGHELREFIYSQIEDAKKTMQAFGDAMKREGTIDERY